MVPDGFIHGDRKAEVRVPYSWAVNSKTWNLNVDIDTMLNKIFFVTEKEKVGMMLFLYTQLSYLATLFKLAKLPVKYVFALIGERGSMKTSLAQAVALGCWEDPMKELQVPFISTAAGIESIVDCGADRVVLVDDYKPTLDRNQKAVLQTNLELVTRIFGDETGKKRNTDFLNPEIEKKTYSARGGCVITGELLDVAVESSVARMLICTMDNASVDVECLTWLQKNKHIMACFQTQFLNYIAKNQTVVLSFIERRTEEIRSAYQKKFSNARYSEYLAQLFCVIELMENFLKDQYPGVDRNFFVVARGVVFDWIRENSKNLQTKSVYVQVVDALGWMISSDEVPMENLSHPTCSRSAKVYVSADYVYFERSSIYELFQRYCKKTGIQIPISSKAELEAVLLSKGVIVKEYSEGRETIGVKRPIRGEYDGRRFLKVPTDILRQLKEEHGAV